MTNYPPMSQLRSSKKERKASEWQKNRIENFLFLTSNPFIEIKRHYQKKGEMKLNLNDKPVKTWNAAKQGARVILQLCAVKKLN